MAIRSKDELLASIRLQIGDDKSDEAIALLEDISDTYNDMQSRISGDGKDWKTLYEENDKAWRQKYRDRFFNSEDKNDDNSSETIDNEERLTYEKLFKEE